MERPSEAFEDLERQIRERGVRVQERLALLRLLRSKGTEQLITQRRQALELVKKAAWQLQRELG